jgi:transmembrane sensor
LIGAASQTIQTERGERREVTLADGSVLQVDPDTRLRIRFDSGFRRVALEKGRALFHVAKNPKRPFLVDIDGTLVRAVGTAFGVERQEQGIIVTVSEGTVEVTRPTVTGQPASWVRSKAETTDKPRTPALLDSPRSLSTLPQDQPEAPILLNPGQQVTVHASGPTEPVRKVDSGRELAWAQGRLIFDNVTVAEVAQLFNRYNRLQLRITDEKLGRRSVSGVFNASEPESFVAFIESSASVRVIRHDGQDVTIASSSPSPSP